MFLKEKVIKETFDFFEKSRDFNGISISSLAKKIGVEYKTLLPIVKELILEEIASVQEGVNPHIIRFSHYDKEVQLKLLKEAEENEIKVIKTIKPTGFNVEVQMINITSESHLLCIYPSQKYLKENITNKYDLTPFTKRLAFGEAQLIPVFFEIDVLERYFLDPRYNFKFEDYSGQISLTMKQGTHSLLKEMDQVFIKTFGLGYDEFENRVAVVYLRYLSKLPPEHQSHWISKLVTTPCKMVKEYYENTILGSWISSQSIFSAVIEEQRIVSEMSQLIMGKSLFKQIFEGDKRPKEFTFFMSPTLFNYHNFISLLDKMISENINKKFFKNKVDEFEINSVSKGVVERKPKGTIRLLDEWLRENYKLQDETGYEKLIAPFKEVRKERQKPAHEINENYYDKGFFKKQMDLLDKVYVSLINLRFIFHQHPLASSVRIPEWIKNGEIKNF